MVITSSVAIFVSTTVFCIFLAFMDSSVRDREIIGG